jgi:glycosyltransferase involved in cell wall biosynthesis
MPPKVSVIVPNYNHARFLRQRLDSIFNQTFQDFEVIILDDCSTDNSKEVIEEYRNRSQVSHIVYNETNSGSPFKQWAKGFDLAQGEYIWIAESDDWAEITFLEKMTNTIENYPDLSFAFCDSYIIYSNKTERKTLYKENTFNDGLSFIKDNMIKNASVYNASAALFRKNSLTKIKHDYQDFIGSGDYLFWIYLCEIGNVFYLSEPLNYFQQHESNTTKKNLFSGNVYKENFKIFTYLYSKGYVSFFKKQSIVLNYLTQLKDENKKRPINPKEYDEITRLWENVFFYSKAHLYFFKNQNQNIFLAIIKKPIIKYKRINSFTSRKEALVVNDRMKITLCKRENIYLINA